MPVGFANAPPTARQRKSGHPRLLPAFIPGALAHTEIPPF